jgi:DNA repair exonuclease SbcCD ATPase subunit
MKEFSAHFGDRPNLTVNSLTSPRPSPANLELDDELFLPPNVHRGGGNRPVPERPFNSAPAAGKVSANGGSSGQPMPPPAAPLATPKAPPRSGSPPVSPGGPGQGNGVRQGNPVSVRQADPPVDPDGRRWPKLPPVPAVPVKAMENALSEQSAELALRCAQIADLCNIRQQQATELQIACDEIERLCGSIAELEATVAQRESDTTAAMQNLLHSEKEKMALRAQLEKAQQDSAGALQRLLGAETELNDKELAIASALERIEELKEQLAIKPEEIARIAEAVEEANQRHRSELNRRSMHFEEQIKKFEGMIADRDAEIKNLQVARAKADMRSDDFTRTIASLENEQQQVREKIDSRANHVEFLETVLQVEREETERKIAELTAELERARLQHSAAERATAEMRKGIVLLLPKLAARRTRPELPEQTTAITQTNAA